MPLVSTFPPTLPDSMLLYSTVSGSGTSADMTTRPIIGGSALVIRSVFTRAGGSTSTSYSIDLGFWSDQTSAVIFGVAPVSRCNAPSLPVAGAYTLSTPTLSVAATASHDIVIVVPVTYPQHGGFRLIYNSLIGGVAGDLRQMYVACVDTIRTP